MTTPIDILRDLISFKSISGQENLGIVSYLEDALKPLGFATTRLISPDEPKRYNLLCQIGPDESGGLMLSGHMDVVPVAGQNWNTDPFVLTAKDSRLYGRGTADMKGFIAATCHALKSLKLAKLKKPLTLLWTYDEEVGCLGSSQAAPLLKNHLKHLPSSALIGEPTEFRILRMHSGHVTVRIFFKGKGAHSSDPSRGISAIKALNMAMNGLFELEDELKKELVLPEYFSRPFVTLNVGRVDGGTAVNIVPDEALAILGFRPLPKTSIEEIFQRIVNACHKYQADDKVRIDAQIERISPPMITKEHSKLEQILKPFANEGTCAAHYSTDGGNLSQSGIECLIFGPGTIDVAHKANEWIEASHIAVASEKLIKIIDKWQE